MELTYYGRTCVRIRSREATIAYEKHEALMFAASVLVVGLAAREIARRQAGPKEIIEAVPPPRPSLGWRLLGPGRTSGWRVPRLSSSMPPGMRARAAGSVFQTASNIARFSRISRMRRADSWRSISLRCVAMQF